MICEIVRFSSTYQSTLGLFYIDDEFQCFTLEDPHRPVKVPGDTRIPNGRYALSLRTEGGMHEDYAKRFGARHKGMLWVRDVDGFEWVYLHIGNWVRDTQGCPLLTNTVSENKTRPGFGGESTDAYLRVYPRIADAILLGEKVELTVWSLDEPFR